MYVVYIPGRQTLVLMVKLNFKDLIFEIVMLLKCKEGVSKVN